MSIQDYSSPWYRPDVTLEEVEGVCERDDVPEDVKALMVALYEQRNSWKSTAEDYNHYWEKCAEGEYKHYNGRVRALQLAKRIRDSK